MKKIYRSLTHVASVFLLLFMAFAALAQSRVVTGTIADDQGGPMPGVNVVIKGTTTGTTTNASGVYSIEASENDILVVSFIGYTTQEIRVGSQTKIDVSLSEDIATLDEIVVVGYGTQKKSDLTGAVSRVGAEELKGSIVTNIDQALQGRVAGVNISSNSGAPGAATTINIRGISTFGGSQPLYVIDGVQMSGQGGMTAAFTDGANGNTVVNPLSTINPNDIESIDVLKDASAAAIYGSQASNGVIIITTKRGKAGAPKISYNTYYALQTPRKKLDVMNLREYASYRADVARDFGNDPAQQYLDPSILGKGTDWQDAIFRTAPMLSHDLSVSGGNDKTTYAIMGGYFKQDGMAINSGLSRFTTRMNLDTKLKDWFTLGTNISYSNVTENMIMDASGDGVISQALTMAPDVPVRDIDGNFAGPSQQNSGSAEMQSNPVGLAQMRVNDLKRQRFLINTYADASIIKNLNVRTELSIDNNFSQNINFSPSYKWGSLVEGESQLQDQRSNSFYWIWKTYATYNKNIGSHHFQLMVGHEMQKNKFEQTYVLKRNLANGDLLALSQGDQLNQTTNGQINENSLMSYYGRLEYDFKDKYLVKFILRGDGSSKFGPENRWGYFPAASIGWKVSNESFFPQSEIVSEIKLRAGYGEVGNQNIPNFAYTSTFGSVNSPFGTTYRLNNMENPAVKWEASTQYNVGLDVLLFDGRIDLIVDAYHKSSRDFLMQLPLPNIYGGGSGQGAIGSPYVNLGKMDNRGIDVSLNTVNIDRGKFKWKTGLTYSVYRNEIVELATDNSAVTANSYFYGVFDIFTRSVIDRPIGQFYGFVTDGIFETEEQILAAPVQVLQDGSVSTENPQGLNYVHNRDGVWLGDIKYKDINNDGVINTDDQTFIGNPNPKFSFGLNNSFTYGNFDLTVYITGVYGFDIFNASRIRTEGMLNQSNNQLATIANRAQIEMIDPTGSLDDINNVRLINPGTDIPRFTSTNVNGNARIMQDRWIEDGSFVRIQNVSLGYMLPSSLISKVNLNRVRVYFNAQNLHVFTNYSGLDPEVGASNQNILTAGIDTGRYPTPRVFTLGLNVDF